jgi:hypothetical protein
MPQIPPSADDIASKYNDLLRRVENLETARPLESASIGAGGVQVIDGGSIKVVAPNGTITATFGALPSSFNRIDGTPQQGILVRREDGTVALMLADASPTTNPIKQSWQFQDRIANIVLADDTNGGVGIARPYMSMGQWVDNVASGSSATPTTSATFVTQQVAHVYRSQPRLVAGAIVNSTSAGTTGEIQITDFVGAAIGSPVAVPANAVSYVFFGPVAWPSWSFLDNGLLNLQARRTAGTGSIGVRGISLWGFQS